jgi:hypothetical protein
LVLAESGTLKNLNVLMKSQEIKKARERGTRLGWRQFVVFGLILSLLPGCTVNLTQVLIPLAYAGIGMCIALLVSPSATAAVVGFVLGGAIGAAVYNNSLKADLMERQGLNPERRRE